MKVRINAHGNALPEAHGEWIDLCTAEDTTLSFLEYKIISLGISIEIPAGYYAHIVPRSSTFGKWGILLANSMGVIENDYCGDGDVWGFPGQPFQREHAFVSSDLWRKRRLLSLCRWRAWETKTGADMEAPESGRA